MVSRTYAVAAPGSLILKWSGIVSDLTLAQAEAIATAALAHGRRLKLKPLTIAIIDISGELKALKREDDAAPLRPAIALGKAWGALWLRMPSSELASIAKDRPSFFAAIIGNAPGKIVPAPGGILIVANGEVIGAIGVSGDLSEQDEVCAIAGLKAAAL